jgi:hypothetical protein
VALDQWGDSRPNMTLAENAINRRVDLGAAKPHARAPGRDPWIADDLRSNDDDLLEDCGFGRVLVGYFRWHCEAKGQR